MVGMPGEPISNMAPPTLVLALHSVVLIAIVGWTWPVLRRWCAHAVAAWHVVVAGGAVAMTLYLWHLTALVIVTVAEHELHLDRGPVGPLRFWPATVVHLAFFLVVTVALVALMAPFERLPIPWLEPPPPRPGGGIEWSVVAGRGGAGHWTRAVEPRCHRDGRLPVRARDVVCGDPAHPGAGSHRVRGRGARGPAGGRRIDG